MDDGFVVHTDDYSVVRAVDGSVPQMSQLAISEFVDICQVSSYVSSLLYTYPALTVNANDLMIYIYIWYHTQCCCGLRRIINSRVHHECLNLFWDWVPVDFHML